MLGTPDYIAPEQIRDARSADIRADIYSLGCTFYYLLTGKPPFRGDSLWDLYQAHFSMAALPLNLVRPEVPAELAALVAKMMAKEPELRFQEPKEVAQALLPFFKPAMVQPAGTGGETSRSESRVEPIPAAQARPTGHRAASFGPPPLPPEIRRSRPRADGVAGESLIAIENPEPSTRPTEPKSAPTNPVPVNSTARRAPWFWPSLAVGLVLFAFTVVWIGVTLRVKTANGVIYSGKDSVLKVWETPTLDGPQPTETAAASGDSNQEPKTGPEAEKARDAEKVSETEEAPKSQPPAATPESKTVEVQADAKDSNAASGPTAAATQPEPNAGGNKRASDPVVAMRRRVRANQRPPVAGRWRHAANAPEREWWRQSHARRGRLNPWRSGRPARNLVTMGFDPGAAMAE